MNQEELRTYLEHLVSSLQSEDQKLLHARLESLVSAFPFNEYEYIITFLVDRGVVSFNEYEKLRKNYVSANPYLELYSLAPRIFGEVWGQEHLMDLDGRFQKPSKDLDPEYEGQYDLLLKGIRVEVKAARATHTKKRQAMVSKAARWGQGTPFWMNFQQIKLDICDVFVFIGVWVDLIIYWVMSNEEVKQNEYRSHQHRGGVEFQIGITERNIQYFDVFKVNVKALVQSIVTKTKY